MKNARPTFLIRCRFYQLHPGATHLSFRTGAMVDIFGKCRLEQPQRFCLSKECFTLFGPIAYRQPMRERSRTSHSQAIPSFDPSDPQCFQPTLSLAIRWYLKAAIRHRFLLRGLRQGSTWNLQDTVRVRRMCMGLFRCFVG